MPARFHLLLLPLSLLCLVIDANPAWARGAQARAEPVMVAVQTEGRGDLERDFIDESAKFLKYSLPDRPIVIRYLGFDEIQKLADARKIDFALTSPDNYALLERFFGARAAISHRIGEASTPDATKGMVVVVREDDPRLRSLRDLDGKRILVSDRHGTEARIFDREMIHARIEPGQTTALRPESGRHDSDTEKRILREIAAGRYDAGVIPACFYERTRAKDPDVFQSLRFLTTDRVSETRCLSSSIFFPGWTLASFPRTDPLLSTIVAGTLLGMPDEDVRNTWQRGARYTAMHELLETTRDANYQRQTQWNWQAFVAKYDVWIAALVLGILGLAVHSIRAAFLIRRRTQELLKIVAEKRRMSEEAERYNKKLLAFERVGLVGELSSIVAHEVKQPLAVIRNYTRGLQRALAHGETDPVLLHTVLEKIDRQSTKASDIIDHVRSVAKHKHPEAKPMCLSSLLDKAISQFERTKGIPVGKLIEPDVRISADTLEMELLISNLLRNAADATAQLDEKDIRATLAREGNRAVLTIEDNGPTLSDEAFSRLAVPFSTSKPDGLGLGLVIVRRIAEAACGNLAFYRKEAGGLKISVTLPLCEEGDK